MLSTLATTLTLLALTSASPLPEATQELSKAKAYDLVIKLYDPTLPDLDPPVAGSYLGTVHTGAGQNIAIASKSSPGGVKAPYYTNGTDSFSNVLNDLGTAYPWGVQVQSPTEFDYTYPAEHDVAINVGGGTNGIGIEAWNTDLFLGGLGTGNYAVCNRFIGAIRGVAPVIRFVYDGETLPEDCVAIRFTPYCAELNDLPEGSEWTHEFVKEVNCVVPPSS